MISPNSLPPPRPATPPGKQRLSPTSSPCAATPAALQALTDELEKLTEPDLGEDAPEPAPAEPEDDLSDYQAVLTTYNALKAWMKEFKGVARVQIRKRPDLVHDLGL